LLINQNIFQPHDDLQMKNNEDVYYWKKNHKNLSSGR